MFRLLLAIFLVVPIIEIYVLIEVGSRIGAPLTVVLIVFTAVLGAALIRAQGFATIARVQRELTAGELPALTLVEGAFIMVAGALLLTPGFVTDAIGFSLLVPIWRRHMAGALAGKVIAAASQRVGPGFGSFHGGSSTRRDGQSAAQGSVIDGEFTEVRDPFESNAKDARRGRGGHLEPPE